MVLYLCRVRALAESSRWPALACAAQEHFRGILGQLLPEVLLVPGASSEHLAQMAATKLQLSQLTDGLAETRTQARV